MPKTYKVKDSGKRQSFNTGAVRDIQEGKGRYDLIPPLFLERLAKHYEAGARKYGDNNWQKGIPIDRYMDSALRHINKYRMRMDDEDHLTAAIWNLIGAMWTEHMVENGTLPYDLL